MRELLRDLDDALAEIHIEYSEVRDLGDQIVAIGRVRQRGRASGAETDSPLGTVADVISNGKLTCIRTYLDPKEALEAAGLGGRRCRRRTSGHPRLKEATARNQSWPGVDDRHY